MMAIADADSQDDVVPPISRERQTLFWLRDELWRHSHATVSVSPQAAKRMADEINAVLNDEPSTRDRKPRI